MAVKIFFCYAREDEELLNKFKAHLKSLQRQGLIDTWHDRDISAGSEWEREIHEHLNTAQIILLLISPDFINSEYCYSVEMKHALERHARKEVCVIPVILRYAYWQIVELAKLQALPVDAKPIMSGSWHNIDEAFFNIIEGIHKVIEQMSIIIPTQEVSKPSVQSNIQSTNNSTQGTENKNPIEHNFQTLSGHGQQVSPKFTLQQGLVTFHMTHNGNRSFWVRLLDDAGKTMSLLVAHNGVFDGAKAVGIRKPGVYLLNIRADGYWKIEFEQ